MITKPNVILVLSDHDPSGLIMGKSLQKGIDAYNNKGLDISVERIALTYNQIVKRNKIHLTSPLKKDPRKESYIKKYGKRVWELDCLEPEELKKSQWAENSVNNT